MLSCDRNSFEQHKSSRNCGQQQQQQQPGETTQFAVTTDRPLISRALLQRCPSYLSLSLSIPPSTCLPQLADFGSFLTASFLLFSYLESLSRFFSPLTSPSSHHVVSHTLDSALRGLQWRRPAFPPRTGPLRPEWWLWHWYPHWLPAIPSQQAPRSCRRCCFAATLPAAHALGHSRHSWFPAPRSLRGGPGLHCRHL